MTKPHLDIETGLSWLGSLLKYIKEYGVFKIVKALLLLITTSLALRVCYDPMFIFDKYTEYADKKHTAELMNRNEYDKQIKLKLPAYLYRYHANRVWLIQYHNGIMDWQHGTMRFEVCDDSTRSVRNQYDNFNLTWLNMPYYLQENEVFIGSIDQVKEIDPVLYDQFVKNDVDYLACAVIRDSEGRPIGILGLSWYKSAVDVSNFKTKIFNYLMEDRGEIKTLIQRQ